MPASTQHSCPLDCQFEGHETVECYFCTTKTKLKDMRNHVGKHILCAFRNVEDSLSLKDGMQIGVSPYGWCGREGCKVQSSNNNNISSSYSYYYTKMSKLPSILKPLHAQMSQ
jgi:hypothetical protein